MKIKTLFAAILAAGLLFSGCRQDEDYVLPDLRVGTESLEFGQQSNEQTVDVTASREWLVRSKPDWVAIDPDHGPASSAPQRVTVTVLDNAGYDRSGDVVFSIGLSKAAVTVSQKGAKGAKSNGTGTLEDPYTVEGANAAVANLTWTSNTEYQTTDVVYVKGIISRIADNGTFAQSGTFGNANFYISDDGTVGEKDFYCYRVLYLGNQKFTSGTDIKVGDEVIVCGKLMNYRGNTPETSSGSYVYSLNGETGGGGGGGQTGTPQGTGTQADPYNVAAGLAAVANLTWTSNTDYQATDVVYMKGKISRIAENGSFAQTGTYGNANFYISDDGTTNSEFYCYRVLYLGNQKYTSGTDIKVGDEVIICGKLMNYRGNTPETVANEAYLYSLNGVTESGGGGGGGGQTGTASGTGTQADPYNVVAATEAVANLTWTSNTEYQTTAEVYVKGKISKIASNGTFGQSGDYGNASFYISDDGATGGKELYCFRILYLGNQKYTSGTDIKVGDEVIIYGKLMNYRGDTPETEANKCYLYSLNGTTQGGGGGGGQQTGTTYSKVSSITAGGKYILVGIKEGKYYAATPIASDKTYGRLNGKEISVSGDKIATDLAANEFTITAVSGGYEIAMPDGRKLAVDTEHDGTFQIGDNFDHTFTAELSGDLFKISHKSTGKTIYHGGGTYTNFSCSATVPADGTLLQLYLKDNK